MPSFWLNISLFLPELAALALTVLLQWFEVQGEMKCLPLWESIGKRFSCWPYALVRPASSRAHTFTGDTHTHTQLGVTHNPIWHDKRKASFNLSLFLLSFYILCSLYSLHLYISFFNTFMSLFISFILYICKFLFLYLCVLIYFLYTSSTCYTRWTEGNEGVITHSTFQTFFPSLPLLSYNFCAAAVLFLCIVFFDWIIYILYSALSCLSIFNSHFFFGKSLQWLQTNLEEFKKQKIRLSV